MTYEIIKKDPTKGILTKIAEFTYELERRELYIQF